MTKTYRPKDLSEALDIKASTNAVPLAGGTDLMVRAKRWSGLAPAFQSDVMFIGHLEELRRIADDNDYLTIGAGCTLTEVFENPITPDILKQAISNMASPAIRNIATIGGNICNASPAGDTLPPLYALGAEIIVQSKSGERKIPIEQFIVGPGETILQSDEIVGEIIVPLDKFDKTFYRKIGTRKATALAKISFVGLARISGDIVENIRIAFGAVAPTVVRDEKIEDKIRGKKIAEIFDIANEIAQEYSLQIRPIDDQRSTAQYRKEVSLRLLKYFWESVVV